MARAPPATAASRRAALTWAPSLALKPSRTTLLSPWKVGGDSILTMMYYHADMLTVAVTASKVVIRLKGG